MVNLASTAIIAHYNAAVELEFMSLWSEAKEEFETAAALAKIALSDGNPIHARIAKAL